MDRPFVFGKAVDEANFIGREQECERLTMNFTHGINTILMSPRRWGKTSIVQRTIAKVRSKSLYVVFFDAFACRNEYDFCNKFASEILSQTNNKLDEIKNSAGEFLMRLSPKISYSFDGGMNDWSLSLGINSKTHKPEEVYQLPQTIASKKGIEILICIDEFQQVGNFPDSLTVQKRMRSVWQHQPNVTYCLFGSKKHMMESLFLDRSYPFYKFGDIVPLNPIEEEKWIPYITKGFAREGKSIDESFAAKICQMTKLNPSYIQQLAWLTLVNTYSAVTEAIIEKSFQDLLQENAPLFTAQTEHLTSYQLNFIRAIIKGIHKDFSKTNIREEYYLGSPTNVKRLKESLTNSEIVTTTSEGVTIADPIMEEWLKRNIL